MRLITKRIDGRIWIKIKTMKAKLLKSIQCGYIHIMQGTEITVTNIGTVNSVCSFIDYTFPVSNSDLELIE